MQTELEVALTDIEILAAYLSKTDTGDVTREALESLLILRNKYQDTGRLDAAEEYQVWQSLAEILSGLQLDFNQIKKQVASSGEYALGKRQIYTDVLYQHMKVYGIVACIWVFLLLLCHSYYMIGKDVVTKNNELFEQRNAMKLSLESKANLLKDTNASSENSKEYRELASNVLILDQKFDANRIILMHWNRVWRLGTPFEAEFSIYDNAVYQSKIDRHNTQEKPSAEPPLTRGQNVSTDLMLERALNESRNIFFRNLLSANFILSLLADYILPILYGCLGAFVKILRDMYRQYSGNILVKRSYWDCNLQIFLGGITAMSAKLIFFESPSTATGAGLSPLVLAFVVGYNIESLFYHLDNIVNSMQKKKK